MKNAISISAFALLACALSIACAQSVAPAGGEKQFLALASIDFGNIYFEDGAADGTITEEDLVQSFAGSGKFAAVKKFLDLREKTIPVLIAHLDDRTPTHTQFKGNPVPLGHMALDILSHSIGRNGQVFDLDCADDGLGACFKSGFYFRPDAGPVEMARVKHSWQRLYAKRSLQYERPWGSG